MRVFVFALAACFCSAALGQSPSVRIADPAPILVDQAVKSAQATAPIVGSTLAEAVRQQPGTLTPLSTGSLTPAQATLLLQLLTQQQAAPATVSRSPTLDPAVLQMLLQFYQQGATVPVQQAGVPQVVLEHDFDIPAYIPVDHSQTAPRPRVLVEVVKTNCFKNFARNFIRMFTSDPGPPCGCTVH